MSYNFGTWDRNVLEEQVTPIQGDLTGTIPPWLRGSLLIDGPGRMTFGETEFNHVFDGAAILQKFSIGDSDVSYSSRYLQTYAYTTNLEHGQVVVSEFGTAGKSVAKGKLAKLGDKFAFDRIFSDNAPVGVVKFGGEYYCSTEAPFLHKIDPNTLATVAKIDLHKDLGINSHCPNPHTLADGTTINILHGVGATGPKYDIMAFPPKPLDGKESVFTKPKKVGSVDARWKLNPCHMHTFGLTENYVVLLEQPLTVDVKAMVTNTIMAKPLIEGMEWIKDKLVKIHLVHRETGKIVRQKAKCEAFFFMHIVNCYEKDNHVVIDVNAYMKADLLHLFQLKNLRNNVSKPEPVSGSVKRIVLPLVIPDNATTDQNLVTLADSKARACKVKDGSLVLTPEVMAPHTFEPPYLHPNRIAQPYRYFYGNCGDMSQDIGLVGKVDLVARDVKTWGEPGMYGALPYFVPRPGSTAEDDGVVLVHLLDGSDKERVSLVVLEAAGMTELARVVFKAPSDAPRGLHGCFIPS